MTCCLNFGTEISTRVLNTRSKVARNLAEPTGNTPSACCGSAATARIEEAMKCDAEPVREDLQINDNPLLSSLDGLESVSQVGGSVEIELNDILPDILSLEELQAYITSSDLRGPLQRF